MSSALKMEESKEEENCNEYEEESSWWGSWPVWLQAAKEKSSTALEFMKRDLTELSQTVQLDAAAAVSSTAALLKDKLMVESTGSMANKARQGISSILGTITDVFTPMKELEDSEVLMIKNSELVALDWWQAQLYTIRKDPETYCHEPEGPPEVYENWLESFDIDEHVEEMSDMMINSREVRALYGELVPTAVSHLEFWQRYFYRVHLLKKADAKRNELLRQAEQISLDYIQWGKADSNDQELKSESSDKVASSSMFASQNSDVPTAAEYKIDIQTTQSMRMDMVHPQVPLDETEVTQSTFTNPHSRNLTKIYQKDCNAVDSLSNNNDTSKNDNLANSCNKEVSGSKVDSLLATKSKDNENQIILDANIDSPHSSESVGKDYSTGDEWEKDFDLETVENDIKLDEQTQQQRKHEGDDEDWESWE